MSWSSGKDSAWTLYVLQQRPDIELFGLATTINSEHDRVAMHAVRTELLKRQAAAAGLPLYEIPLPNPCSNEIYEQAMARFIDLIKTRGVTHMAFGDLFLADIRQYREEQLAGTGITPLFPLWGEPTDALAQKMAANGLKARITCVDPRQLAHEFCGRRFDQDFLHSLPAEVDPCGENGEFHSFAYDGPMFQRPIMLQPGDTVERDGFVFTDLLPRE